MARDNRTPASSSGRSAAGAAGVPQIEVTFDHRPPTHRQRQAKDLGTEGTEVTITASSGLSKDEVDRMMREAESHADEDKKEDGLSCATRPISRVRRGADVEETGTSWGVPERSATESGWKR